MNTKTKINIIYYGEEKCSATYKSSGKACRNKAYYSVENKMVCGVHSRNKDRKTLPKNPHVKENKERMLKERQQLVEQVAKKNREKGVKGKVVCSKLRMMKAAEHIDGFLKIFPNFKHQNRKDGFGCASLSPKSMGPINHGQQDLPMALNLENFHQGNKCFDCEVEKDEILDVFYETQLTMYQDPIPRRHKETASSAKGSKNIPLFSVWKNKNGDEVRISYFESRQFYCTFYERMALKSKDFKALKKKLDDGYNLEIVGYDAYDVVESVEKCYLDTGRPFGHELVLYTLLTVAPTQYPWRKYKTFEF